MIRILSIGRWLVVNGRWSVAGGRWSVVGVVHDPLVINNDVETCLCDILEILNCTLRKLEEIESKCFFIIKYGVIQESQCSRKHVSRIKNPCESRRRI